ncbi:hypothetical protein AN1V17_43510 [Vallitalea sediminicola]
MNHEPRKTQEIDIDRELMKLRKQEIAVPENLSKITYNKIQVENEKKDRAVTWIAAFALAINFIITFASILGIGLGLNLKLYQWIIVLSVTMTINVSILALVLIYKDVIIKEVSRLSIKL